MQQLDWKETNLELGIAGEVDPSGKILLVVQAQEEFSAQMQAYGVELVLAEEVQDALQRLKS